MWMSLFQLRGKQIYRIILELGKIRIPLYLLGLAFFYRIYFDIVSNSDFNVFVALGLSLILLIIQLKRDDIDFLSSVLSNHRLYLFTEYLLFSLPFSFIFLLHKEFLMFAGIIGFSGLLTFIKKPQTNTPSIFNRLIDIIPDESFEWKSGIRQSLFLIIPIYIAAIIGSYQMPVIPVAILILWLITFSFVEKGEPLSHLIALELSPKEYLIHKMGKQVILFNCMVAPLALIYIVLHYNEWFLIIGILSVQCFLNIYIVIVKYAFYTPNEESKAAQTMSGLGVISLIIPFFIPVVIGLSIKYYFQSIQNLTTYLHDFDTRT